MLTNMCLALVPRSDSYKPLVDYCKVYHVILGLNLSSNADKGLGNIKRDTNTYIEAVLDSSYLPDELKIFYIDIFKISEKGELTQAARSICDAYSVIWTHFNSGLDLSSFERKLHGLKKAPILGNIHRNRDCPLQQNFLTNHSIDYLSCINFSIKDSV